jgi:hypothetical protein
VLWRLEEADGIGDEFPEFLRRLQARFSVNAEIAAASLCGVTFLAIIWSVLFYGHLDPSLRNDNQDWLYLFAFYSV